MDDEKKQIIENLRTVSPLEVTKILQEMELYDAKSSQEIIDEVYEQFASNNNMKDEIVKPVFLSIVDGILEGTSIGRSARKKGLTASRFMQECESFRYEEEPSISDINGYIEYKNAREYANSYGELNRPNYERAKYEDKNAMNNYKIDKINENGGKKNLQDEYTGKNNITAYRNNPDKRRNDPKNNYQAEPDHIVPLKQVHELYKNNYALSDEDIKRIANQKDNLALTSAEINGKKLDSSNSQFIKEQDVLKKQGKPYIELDDETRKRMIALERKAKKELDNSVNNTVFENLTGKGTADRETRKEAYKAEEERLGRKLSSEERATIDKNLSKDKQKEIYGTATKNAVDQAKDYAVGNLILYIVKPIYYEISDILANGMQEGVSASSTIEALKIRFGRVKKYVVENAASFLGDSVWEFVKGFVSSLIEGIIGLFVGIFKQVLKVIKEGIKIFVQSAKVLFGKESKNMSAAEKGDAIIKILGGSIIAISGVAIEALINKIGIVEPWSVILSTMLSGIASVLFMYLLNKLDIFSVKSEKRRDRIIEIFEERIRDIREATDTYNANAIETLIRQREEFEGIKNNIDNALKKNNINEINTGLYKMANFMNINLEYSNTEEFCDYMDSEDMIYL